MAQIVRTMGRLFKLPPMNTIFGVKRNPLQDDYRVKQMINKVYEYSLMTPEEYFKIKDVTVFTAYFHPFCTDVRKYVNLARVMQLFFVFDDHTECEWGDVARGTNQSQEIWGQFYDCLDRVMDNTMSISMANWKPYVLLHYIAFEEMYQDYAEDQMRRLLQTYREYGQANQKECQYIEESYQVKSLDEYLSLRMYSSGSKCVFQMIEYADDLHLTDQEWYDPLMQHFTDHAAILIVLANDIVSIEKELLQSNGQPHRLFNLVALTMIWQNCDVSGAIVKTLEMFHDYEKRTKLIMQQLLDRPNTRQDVKKFIEMADYSIGGNFAGGLIISRYNEVFDITKDSSSVN